MNKFIIVIWNLTYSLNYKEQIHVWSVAFSGIWFVSQPVFVVFCRVCSSTAVDVRALGPSSFSGIPYQCMHCSTMCLCFVCCSIAWDSCPEDSVSWCFLPSNLTAGFLLQGLFLQAVTLALGRQVGCSSTLGCDCSCSSWAPWAPSLHL